MSGTHGAAPVLVAPHGSFGWWYDRVRRAASRGWLALAFAAYGVLGLGAYFPVWPGDPHRLPTCACSDLVQTAWFLRWTPFAVAHGHDPFFTTWIDLPRGANLAHDTSVPLLGLIAAPFTVAFGPVASLNLLLWLAIVLSATSCAWVLGRWVTSPTARFAGGLLYGFSPYMVGQATGHLNLTFVPIFPLLFLALYELAVAQRGRARRWGLLLGALAGAQLLISPELLLDAGVLAAIGLVALALWRPGEVRRRLPHFAAGVGWAMLVFVPLAVYPLMDWFTAPQRYAGSAHGAYPFPADLLGTVVPGPGQRFAPGSLARVGSRLVTSNAVENGSYLGLPLLAAAAYLAWRARRSAVAVFALVMALVAWVLSLGPRLTVDTHTTVLRLPFDALARLPIVANVAAVRFSLFVDLFVAIVVALGLGCFLRAPSAPLRGRRLGDAGRLGASGAARLARASRAARLAVLGVVAALVTLSLWPRWPYPSFPAAVPSFFRSPAVEAVPAGSVVLVYPYPDNPNDQAMLWQATAAMRFRLLGGYALVPGPDRRVSFQPVPVVPASVPDTLRVDAAGGPPPQMTAPDATATPAAVRTLVRRYHVRAVVAVPAGVHPQAALTLLEAALGPPRQRGGVDVWFTRPAAEG